MILLPGLSAAVRFLQVDGLTYAVSERHVEQISDEVAAEVIRRIDGKKSSDQIIDELSELYPPERVAHALIQLETKSLIFQAPSRDIVTAAAFYNFLGIAAQHGTELVERFPLAIQSLGSSDVSAFYLALSEAGFPLVAEGAKLRIVVTNDYLRPELADINGEQLRTTTPWLIVKPQGLRPMLGPLFDPEQETACWECLSFRLRRNSQLEDKAIATFIQIGNLPQLLPALQRILAGWATIKLMQYCVTRRQANPLRDMVSEFNAVSSIESHHVVRRLQCPACGTPEGGLPGAGRPISITGNSAFRAFPNSYRSVDPSELFDRLNYRTVSPLTGVVQQLIDVPTELGGLIKNCGARHFFPAYRSSWSLVRKTNPGTSAGKGRTALEAKLGALCEAIERCSAIFEGASDVATRDSINGIGPLAIDPKECMLYSRTQYDNRSSAKEQQSHYTSVPRPLPADEPIDWTKVWSLTSNAIRLVPTAFCFFGYPHIDEDPFCIADSNGNAAGSSRLEAILQGLFEVIERDAVGIWWYNRIRRPKLDLQSFNDPYFLQLEEFFDSIGRSFWVLDITSDLNVPTFAAISGWTDRLPEDVALGFGAHADARIALNRAIAELNQFAPTILTKASFDHRRYPYASPEAVQWFTTARLTELEYLRPNCDLKARKMTDFPAVTQNSLEELLRSVIENLGREQLEVCVLDLTRPDIDLPVVKVIVPTLRHFWRRLAPGRLYDVPVKLGWRLVPIREEVLNPATIFF